MCIRDRVYDDVVAGLTEQARGLVIGDTLAAETTLGPVHSAKQRARVAGFLERRPAHAEIVTGGCEPDRPGFYLEPTVVAGLRSRKPATRSRCFAELTGPSVVSAASGS